MHVYAIQWLRFGPSKDRETTQSRPRHWWPGQGRRWASQRRHRSNSDPWVKPSSDPTMPIHTNAENPGSRRCTLVIKKKKQHDVSHRGVQWASLLQHPAKALVKSLAREDSSIQIFNQHTKGCATYPLYRQICSSTYKQIWLLYMYILICTCIYFSQK